MFQPITATTTTAAAAKISGERSVFSCLHADRRPQRLGGVGRFGLEAFGGGVAVHLQRIGVGTHIADREGARRQRGVVPAFDGGEILAPADAGGGGQVQLSSAAAVLAHGAQLAADGRIGRPGRLCAIDQRIDQPQGVGREPGI